MFISHLHILNPRDKMKSSAELSRKAAGYQLAAANAAKREADALKSAKKAVTKTKTVTKTTKVTTTTTTKKK